MSEKGDNITSVGRKCCQAASKMCWVFFLHCYNLLVVVQAFKISKDGIETFSSMKGFGLG